MKKIPKKEQYVRANVYLQGKDFLESDGFKEDYLDLTMCVSCFGKAENVLTITLGTRSRKQVFHCNVPVCGECIKKLMKLKGGIDQIR